MRYTESDHRFKHFCPPPFGRTARVHISRLSMILFFWDYVVSNGTKYTLCVQLLLQFYVDPFETLHMFWSWTEDVHVGLI